MDWNGSAKPSFPLWYKTMTHLVPASHHCADVKTSSKIINIKCNQNTSSSRNKKNGALKKCHRPNKLGNIKINCWCLPYSVSYSKKKLSENTRYTICEM